MKQTKIEMEEEPNLKAASAGSTSSAASGGGLTENECNEMIQRSLRTPMVKFLKEHMEKSGCSFGDKFIRGVHCDKQIAGSYVRGEGIRAGHLSGDCHYKREFLRGYMKMRGHEQDCVRRRVMKSVMANPYCSEAAAKDAMEAVWDVCYNDTKPFDRAP